jgi:hypothetical protein
MGRQQWHQTLPLGIGQIMTNQTIIHRDDLHRTIIKDLTGHRGAGTPDRHARLAA